MMKLVDTRAWHINNYMRENGWISDSVRYENILTLLEKKGRIHEVVDLIDNYSIGKCRSFFESFPVYMRDNTKKYSPLVMENVAQAFDSAVANL